MKAARGMTSVTLLFLLVGAAVVYATVAFGPAYWDNVQLRSVLSEAANLSMRASDEKVRDFIDRKMRDLFDAGKWDERGNKLLKIEYDPHEDVRIERTEQPRYVNIWVTYQRHVPLPLIGGERMLNFSQHAEQDLSPVKW